MFRQLSEQGSVVATNVFGDTVVDQILLAMPALMLAASAMVLLRLLPLSLAVGSRLMSNRLSVGLALGLWQMARNPTHYARLSMLLILMAGLGVFVASVGGTLHLNYEERVLYSTGSDMRAEGIFMEPRGLTRPFANKYREMEGVDQVMPAYRGGAFDLSKTPGKRVGILAVDSNRFDEVAWRRPDFAEEPLDEMVESLVYSSPPEGIALPLDANFVLARVRADRPHDSVEVVLRVRGRQQPALLILVRPAHPHGVDRCLRQSPGQEVLIEQQVGDTGAPSPAAVGGGERTQRPAPAGAGMDPGGRAQGR